MEGGYILVGLILIGMGLVLLFGKGIAWEWQVWRNSMRGVPSERTADWEWASTMRGCFCLAVGVLAIGLAIYSETRRQSDSSAFDEQIRRATSPAEPHVDR